MNYSVQCLMLQHGQMVMKNMNREKMES